MEEVNEAIHLLHNSQARHKRKGFKYGANTTNEMLRHAAEELIELVVADAVDGHEDNLRCDIAEELSDLLLILLHYAYVHGFNIDSLQMRMLEKMLKRFTLKPKELAALVRLKGKIISRHKAFQAAGEKARKLRLFGAEET